MKWIRSWILRDMIGSVLKVIAKGICNPVFVETVQNSDVSSSSVPKAALDVTENFGGLEIETFLAWILESSAIFAQERPSAQFEPDPSRIRG